jgi:flagellar hook protein FlgE
MSLLGSLNTAVDGLNAQSAALSTISNNVANSQTVGFKESDTNFADYLTNPGQKEYISGAVTASAQATNSVQGTITQVSDPTALAVSGNGFFAVQQVTGKNSFSPTTSYTRAGDFSPNNQGFLVNSEGYALAGWPANATGTGFNTQSLQPLQISKAPSAPVPTANVTLAANIPSAPASGTTSYSSSEQIYDAAGNAQSLTLTWTQTLKDGSVVSGTNPATADNPVNPQTWALTVAGGSGASATTDGPAMVTFGNTAATAGTIQSITGGTGLTVPTSTAQAAGDPATVGLALDYGLGSQNVNLNLGSFNSTSGVTQYSGSTYAASSQTQDGSPQGNYSSVTIAASGNVTINYDNGATKTVGQVPLATFNNPNGLTAQNGQAFTASVDSGQANVVAAGTAGTGSLTVGAEEGSNVDIATQFTNMIVAQRAYTANTKVVTTANQMLQDTLNLVQG